MRGILQRATLFTEDISQLNEELSNTTTDFRAMVETNHSNSADVDEYIIFSKKLSDQVAMLNSRLEKLQFEDRLYFHDFRKENLLSRIREFVKKHW